MVQLFIRNPSRSYRASPAIWDHTVLPATRHRWTCPTITSARQADTRFTYPTPKWKTELTLIYQDDLQTRHPSK